MNPKPTGNNLKCVKMTSNNVAYISGDFGTLYKTTDAGVSWRSIEIGTFSNIVSMHFFNDNSGYVTTGSLLYKTTNGGMTWGSYQVNQKYIWNINFLNENSGYAIGENGVILFTTNGGVNWIEQISGLNNTLLSSFFLNANTGYITNSNYGSSIIKTTNGGNSWPIYKTAGDSSFNRVYFKDVTTGFISGTRRIYYPPGQFYYYYGFILKTTNGGNDWFNSFSTTNLSGCYNFGILDSNTFICQGNPDLLTTNSGVNWIQVNQDSFTKSISIYNRNGYEVCDSGKIYKITNNGNSYQNIKISFSPYNLNSASFINENTGFIASGYDDTYSLNIIYKTTNGGLNFIPLYSSNRYKFIYVKFADINNGFAFGQYYIQATGDGGNHWNINQSLGATLWNGCMIKNPLTYYAVGQKGGKNVANGVIFKFNVEQWAWSETLFPLNGDLLYSIFFLNKDTGFVGTYWNARIFKTTNGGQNWNMKMNGGGPIFSIYFKDKNTGFAGADMYYYKTTNGGENWNYNGNRNANFYNFTFPDSLNGYSVGSNKVTHTTDGGISWNSYILHTSAELRCIDFPSRLTGYICGGNGFLFKTTNGGTSFVKKEISNIIPDNFSLSQNYPNPFNPTTNIKYQIANKSYVILKVFDILGKEIATLVNEKLKAGEYETTFDGSAFPSGVYFYKLEAGEFIQTKKMLLIK